MENFLNILQYLKNKKCFSLQSLIILSIKASLPSFTSIAFLRSLVSYLFWFSWKFFRFFKNLKSSEYFCFQTLLLSSSAALLRSLVGSLFWSIFSYNPPYFYLKSEMNALDLISNYINDNYNTTLGFRLNFEIT